MKVKWVKAPFYNSFIIFWKPIWIASDLETKEVTFTYVLFYPSTKNLLSSSPSISPNMSSTSTCSRESDDHLSHTSVGDKYLSTILRLDREHNMFGLSNIAIVGSRPSRKMKKDGDKPVFPQTAIVQICCGTGCCRHRVRQEVQRSNLQTIG